MHNFKNWCVKAIIILLLIVTTITASAQTDSTQTVNPNTPTEAPYKRFPTIPPFELLQLDSTTTLTKADLSKKRPLLLMYFSPDCDHCQHQTEDLLKDMRSFKDVQIVFASYQPFDQIKAFHERYRLGDYPNIMIGRDTKYFLAPFFKMYNLPYLALYDKKGDLITTFEGNVKTARLLREFKGSGN